MTTKIKTPGITDANVTTAKLDLISTSGTPGATIKGTSGQTDGYIQLNCSENSHGIKLKSPPHSAAQSYTLTFPQSITNGYFLKTDGSGNLSFAEVNVDDTAWQSSIVTAATLNAVVGYGYWIDTTSNACTITLPGSANVGDQIIFVDYARTWATNAVTINQNSLNFQGNSSPNPVYNTNGQTVNIVYSGATKGWIPISDDDVTDETPQITDAEYLVVAGGGGAGKPGDNRSGGGGAGGLLTNYGGTAISFTGGVTYTVTVGAGGAGGTTGSGAQGANSVLSGSDITTITSIGGGGGGGQTPTTGGSGGGGGDTESGASGTVGQGNAGGNGTPGAVAAGGGGGGAGAVGGNSSSSTGGAGGNGLANSITGASVTYAGGGGGICENGTGGSGGSGGGGAGTNGAGGDGTANLGGGGGAGHTSAGDGGSGVVILRVATAKYSGTTTGSPTVTTDGSDTIIKFNASGSYTA